jgi:DNA-binding transcriptional MerR regulator
VSYPIVPVPGATAPRLSLDAFARAARLHPDLVRRLVVLGLLEPERDRAGRLSFPPAQLVLAARIQRLRRGFALNYAAVGLVLDLLDRVAELERELRTSPRPTGGRSWTSTA